MDKEEIKNDAVIFIEKIGTPSMIREVEKEVNSKFFFVTSTGSPKGDLDRQKERHQKSQLKKVISVLTAIKDQLDFEVNEQKPGKKNDIGYDMFISHASEDKESFALFFEGLKDKGYFKG